MQQMTFTEIAEELDEPVYTVHRTYQRAMRKLAKMDPTLKDKLLSLSRFDNPLVSTYSVAVQ